MRFTAALFAIILPLAFASSSLAQVSDVEFGKSLSSAAIERTHHSVTYDPAYVRLDYPNGDVAQDKGVCADVIIRALRTLDIDLQQLIHED